LKFNFNKVEILSKEKNKYIYYFKIEKEIEKDKEIMIKAHS
jgi:hypothetical protein